MQSSVYRNGRTVSYNKREESYRVIKCPLYLEDEEGPKVKKWDGPYWDAPVCVGCYSRRICQRTRSTCNRRAKC